MRYEISPEIREMMGNIVGCVHGACADICRKYGISTIVMSRVLNGKQSGVEEGTWLRMCEAFPPLRHMAKPSIPDAPGMVARAGGQTIDSFRLRVMDKVLREPRLDERAKTLMLQILAEAADAQPSRQA